MHLAEGPAFAWRVGGWVGGWEHHSEGMSRTRYLWESLGGIAGVKGAPSGFLMLANLWEMEEKP